MYDVSEPMLEALAIGAGILGTGGGGNPYNGKLECRAQVRRGRRIAVVSVDELPDDALVTTVGGMGAPIVSVERLHRGDEPLRAMRALERHLGRRFTHVIPGEIGGANAMAPMVVAAQAGLPVVDGDGMGRAFPELQMDTFAIYGVKPTPGALADPRGHEVVFSEIDDARTLERYARAVTIQMGGRRLFRGKIVDVERRLEGGFARGVLLLDGSGPDAGRRLRIDFQNENLIARDGDGAVLAVVPDLICVVDEDTAEPITTEIVRYGLRVAVVGIPAPAMLRTPEALAVVGPAAFGYPDVPYEPMAGEYGAGAPPA